MDQKKYAEELLGRNTDLINNIDRYKNSRWRKFKAWLKRKKEEFRAWRARRKNRR